MKTNLYQGWCDKGYKRDSNANGDRLIENGLRLCGDTTIIEPDEPDEPSIPPAGGIVIGNLSLYFDEYFFQGTMHTGTITTGIL